MRDIILNMFLRRPYRTFATAALAVSIGAGPAVAAQTGYWNGAASYGTRATIDATATPTVPSNGDFISFVRIQSSITDPNAGLYQTGHHIAGATSLNNCGANRTGWFEEWKVVGGPYHCNGWGLGNSFPSAGLFTVTRDPNAAQYWRMYVNGNFITMKGPLGFNSGVSLAGGEWTGSPGSNYHARWGLASGATVWQLRLGTTTSFINVPATSANVFTEANAFTISGSAPAFSVNR